MRGEGGRKNSEGEGTRLSEGLNCKLYQLPAPNCVTGQIPLLRTLARFLFSVHWPDSSSPYTGQIPLLRTLHHVGNNLRCRSQVGEIPQQVSTWNGRLLSFSTQLPFPFLLLHPPLLQFALFLFCLLPLQKLNAVW